jgi:hypothetical protein
MNEDRDWNYLEDTWKAGTPLPNRTVSAVEAAKAGSRLAAWRVWLSCLAACSTVAVMTSWCALHRSLQSYTFTVIAWSAFFSLVSYLLSTRESVSDLALETTTALERRSKSLARGTQLLDFGRTLIGVEMLICVGFWIALHRGERGQVLPGTGAMVFGGLVLYICLSWILARTRRELKGLRSIAADLRKE